METTGNKPGWLKKLDREETVWAANYLLNRWPDELEPKPDPSPAMVFITFGDSIRTLESDVAGVKLIERLRNAIRQRRYRQAEGGRKTCSFTLPLNTKDKLKILAKNADTTETAIIESLIAGA
ncbi:TPA: hypothetical protein NH783_006333, partial [Pseudomonas aeruginosa]|nr:hypothetical protein [Pseudomonas aeruginosa]